MFCLIRVVVCLQIISFGIFYENRVTPTQTVKVKKLANFDPSVRRISKNPQIATRHDLSIFSWRNKNDNHQITDNSQALESPSLPDVRLQFPHGVHDQHQIRMPGMSRPYINEIAKLQTSSKPHADNTRDLDTHHSRHAIRLAKKSFKKPVKQNDSIQISRLKEPSHEIQINGHPTLVGIDQDQPTRSNFPDQISDSIQKAETSHINNRIVILEQPQNLAQILSKPIMKHGSNLNRNPFYNFKPQGGNRYLEYKDGDRMVTVTPEMKTESDYAAKMRKESVKNSMKYAWTHYRNRAFGYDEIRPITGVPDDSWKGIGVTLVDALDTLWLMDMKDEFWEARDWVRDNLSFDHVDEAGIFEITIRNLGGLLSAYDLSGDEIFLIKAEDLGSRLLNAFESPNGIPFSRTELNGNRRFNHFWQYGTITLAECGTLQMEFRFLSEATGNPIYAEKVNYVFDMLGKAQPSDGLYPLFVRNDNSEIILENDHVTLGANGDSFYEYMLKVWLQGGQTESMYRSMWDKAVHGVHTQLVQRSKPNGLTYVAERKYQLIQHRMEHLACFMGGALALGAYTHPDGLQSTNAQRDLKVGKALTYTCYQMYARTTTGLSPEAVLFGGNEDMLHKTYKDYRLRPEVVESFFILHHLTGDPVYREWGWEVFQAIERYCRTPYGYGQYPDVNDDERRPEDKMESFFMAETLKYLYLLFDSDHKIDLLNTHVFNTEAHPLRRFDVLRKEKVSTD